MSFTINCPICGPRNSYEFRFGGEEKGPRPAEEAQDEKAWCEYVHLNRCVAGIQKEWWFHRDGCRIWFMIYRDTQTNSEVNELKDTHEKAD